MRWLKTFRVCPAETLEAAQKQPELSIYLAQKLLEKLETAHGVLVVPGISLSRQFNLQHFRRIQPEPALNAVLKRRIIECAQGFFIEEVGSHHLQLRPDDPSWNKVYLGVGFYSLGDKTRNRLKRYPVWRTVGPGPEDFLVRLQPDPTTKEQIRSELRRLSEPFPR